MVFKLRCCCSNDAVALAQKNSFRERKSQKEDQTVLNSQRRTAEESDDVGAHLTTAEMERNIEIENLRKEKEDAELRILEEQERKERDEYERDKHEREENARMERERNERDEHEREDNARMERERNERELIEREEEKIELERKNREAEERKRIEELERIEKEEAEREETERKLREQLEREQKVEKERKEREKNEAGEREEMERMDAEEKLRLIRVLEAKKEAKDEFEQSFNKFRNEKVKKGAGYETPRTSREYESKILIGSERKVLESNEKKIREEIERKIRIENIRCRNDENEKKKVEGIQGRESTDPADDKNAWNDSMKVSGEIDEQVSASRRISRIASDRSLAVEIDRSVRIETELKMATENERRKKLENERRLQDENDRKIREENEKKIRGEIERNIIEENDRKMNEENERKIQEEIERKIILEKKKMMVIRNEQRKNEEYERKIQAEEERKLRIETEWKLREDAALRARAEKEQKIKEENEQKLTECQRNPIQEEIIQIISMKESSIKERGKESLLAGGKPADEAGEDKYEGSNEAAIVDDYNEVIEIEEIAGNEEEGDKGEIRGYEEVGGSAPVMVTSLRTDSAPKQQQELEHEQEQLLGSSETVPDTAAVTSCPDISVLIEYSVKAVPSPVRYDASIDVDSQDPGLKGGHRPGQPASSLDSSTDCISNGCKEPIPTFKKQISDSAVPADGEAERIVMNPVQHSLSQSAIPSARKLSKSAVGSEVDEVATL